MVFTIDRSRLLTTLALLLLVQLTLPAASLAAGYHYRVTSVSARNVQTVEEVASYRDWEDRIWGEHIVVSASSVMHYFPANRNAGYGDFDTTITDENCAAGGDCNGLDFKLPVVGQYDSVLDATYSGATAATPIHCERHSPVEGNTLSNSTGPSSISFARDGSSVTFTAYSLMLHLLAPPNQCQGEGDGTIRPSNPVPHPGDWINNNYAFTQSISPSLLSQRNFTLQLKGYREYTVPQDAFGIVEYRYRVTYSLNIGVCRNDGDFNEAGCQYGGAAEGVTLPTPQPRPHTSTCTGRCAGAPPLSDEEKVDLITTSQQQWSDAAQCLAGAAPGASPAVPTAWTKLGSSLTGLGYSIYQVRSCDPQVEAMTTSAIQIADPPAPAHRRVQLVVRPSAVLAPAGACSAVPPARRSLCASIVATAVRHRAASREYAAISMARATSVNRLATALAKGDDHGATIQGAALRAYAAMSASAAARVNGNGAKLASLLATAGIDSTADAASMAAAYGRIQSGAAISAPLLRRLQLAGVVRTRQDAAAALATVRTKLSVPETVSLRTQLRSKIPTRAAAATAASTRSGDLAVLVRALVTQGSITAADARAVLRLLDARSCQATKVRSAVRVMRVRVPASKALVIAGASRMRASC